MCLTLIMVLADMLAGLKKLYGRPHYFQILNTFSYDFWVGCQLANLLQYAAVYCNILIIFGLYNTFIIYISCNMYLRILMIVCNVFHYYINKRKEFVR